MRIFNHDRHYLSIRPTRSVIEALLKTLPAGEIVAAVRHPEKVADLAARGVQVRLANYDEPASLLAAFKGADKLLLAESDVGASKGGLFDDGRQLIALIGRPRTPMTELVRLALGGLSNGSLEIKLPAEQSWQSGLPG